LRRRSNGPGHEVLYNQQFLEPVPSPIRLAVALPAFNLYMSLAFARPIVGKFSEAAVTPAAAIVRKSRRCILLISHGD
jgi:hypothetical protein